MEASLQCSWKDEINAYESKMAAYFKESSERLQECYNTADSDDLKAEYLRLSDEKQRYQKYVHSLKDIASSGENPTDINKAFDSKDKYVTSEDKWNGLSVDTTSSINAETCSAVTVTACYTQYYEEMIAYFNKLLNTIELTNLDGCSSSDGEETTAVKISDEESIPSPMRADGDYCSDPRAIMDQYFERYGAQGKWDWVSWNNYLSWIARTYPRWYNIFMEQSRSIGIDWREMYNRWSHSDTTGEHSLPVYAYPVVSDDFSVGLQGGFLYEGDDPSDELYCETCKQRFASERMFSIHLRAVTHTQNVLRSTSNCAPVSNPIEEKIPLYDTGSQPLQDSRYQTYPGSEFIQSGTFFCELCQVSSMSQISLRYHLAGRLHTENVAIFYQTGDVNQLLQKRAPRPKIDIRLQPLLDVCTKPLVGLNYITEFQFTGDDGCAYACELCMQQFGQQDAIPHLCSTSHRLAYFKETSQLDRSLSVKTEEVAEDALGTPNSFRSESPSNDVEEGEVTEDSSDENSSRVKCEKERPRSSRLGDLKACDVQLPHHSVPVSLEQETKEFIDGLKSDGFLRLTAETVEKLVGVNLEDHLEYEADWALCRAHRFHEDAYPEHQTAAESVSLCERVDAEDQSQPLPGALHSDTTHTVDPPMSAQSQSADQSAVPTSSIPTSTPTPPVPALSPHLDTNTYYNRESNSSTFTDQETTHGCNTFQQEITDNHFSPRPQEQRMPFSPTSANYARGQWRRYANGTENHFTNIRPNAFTHTLPPADWRFPRGERQPVHSSPINCLAEAGRPRLIPPPMLPPTNSFPEEAGHFGVRCEPQRLFRLPIALNERESLHPSDAMFDGYALYSRRGDRKARRLSETPPVRFPKPRNMPRGGSSSGRKLSAIADFLGINEPPAPCSRARDPVPHTNPPAAGLPHPHGVSLGHLRAPYQPNPYHDAFRSPLRFGPPVPSVTPTHMVQPIMPNTFIRPVINIHALLGHPTALQRR